MPQVNEENSKPEKIDKKDLKILQILKQNSRETIQQISKKSRLSRDSVSYRIKKLERLGIIDKYSLELNHELMGFGRYYIFFQLVESASKQMERFYSYLIKKNKVVNVLNYSDKWDLRIEIWSENIRELDSILTEINKKFSNIIIDIEILEEIKDYRYPQVGERLKKLKFDKEDNRIINILSKNSRIPFIEIAKKTNLSPDAIIYRMKKYSKLGIIRKYATLTNINKEGYHWYTLLILMKVLTKEQEEKFISLIKRHKNITRIIKTIGDWNIMGDVIAKNPKEFHSIVKEIRTIFKKVLKDYDTLLAYKELKNQIIII